MAAGTTTTVKQYTETSANQTSTKGTVSSTTNQTSTTETMSSTTNQASTTGKMLSTTYQTSTTRKMSTTYHTSTTGKMSTTYHTSNTGKMSSTTNQISTTGKVLSTTNQKCVSRSECNNLNTFIHFPLTMPCPPGHEDCVNNTCFCNPEKVSTKSNSTNPCQSLCLGDIFPTSSRSCHQCGDPVANISCDIRMVYLGNLQECGSGTYCMTDVVQRADGSVAIYKRCVDELTCRNEWLAQTSDQDRCLKYAEGALPGQYTCHFCCTTDGCNSKIVPEAKYFYSTSSSNIN
ncbi:uncharacterized protein LOC133194969 [Saccostrea echinata]|uniref:uncharacterized protein LOC133194969 n=1 Tax=Saccostrea echinata TaxID=191078 RepID=UPI002A820196|nr:uncharacterized protein LOC133194969 [Saccostrea echinata]